MVLKYTYKDTFLVCICIASNTVTGSSNNSLMHWVRWNKRYKWKFRFKLEMNLQCLKVSLMSWDTACMIRRNEFHYRLAWLLHQSKLAVGKVIDQRGLFSSDSWQGGSVTKHSLMTSLWVCVCPHGQISESVMPYIFKLAAKIPAPVHNRFICTQGFLKLLLPGGWCIQGCKYDLSW